MRILVAALFVVSSLALAQNYPAKPVTIIVPYPAGGPTDTLARQLAPIFTRSSASRSWSRTSRAATP